MNRVHLFLMMLMILPANDSWAIFELRVTYNSLANRPDFADLTELSSPPEPVSSTGLGADAILTLPLPLIPGIGVRYENLGYTSKKGENEVKGNFSRTAALVNWRLLNNVIFLGPIFTYGTSHSNKTKVTKGSVETEWVSPSVSSFQAGLEGGFNIINMTVGAEVGYHVLKFKDARAQPDNLSDELTIKKTIDMSGTYFKLMLGFAI